MYSTFQSHEPEFDYLKSLEIEEKINKIRWLPQQNAAHFLLSTNGDKPRGRPRLPVTRPGLDCGRAHAHTHTHSVPTGCHINRLSHPNSCQSQT